VLGQPIEVVELGPGEDPASVRFGAGQASGSGTGGDQDDVSGEVLRHVATDRRTGALLPGSQPRSGRRAHVHGPRADGVQAPQAGAAVDDLNTLLGHAHRQVMGLLTGQAPNAGVERRHLRCVLLARLLPVGEGSCQGLRGGNKGLGRDDVGQDGRATQAPILDQPHLGPELGGHQGGLVARWPASDDDDALTASDR